MRHIGIAIVALGAVGWAVVAAQDPEDDPATAGKASPQLLSVELTHLVIADVDDDLAAQLSTAQDLRGEIRRLEQAGKVKIQERIGLTALENEQSTAQFGRRVPIVVGETVAARGVRTQQTQYTDVGTVLQVMSRMEGDNVFMQLMFESSRHEPQQDANLPPTVATMNVNTSLKMKFGETVLVSASKSEDHSLLVVTCGPRGRGRGTAGRPGRSGAPRAAAGVRGGRPGTTGDRAAVYAKGLVGRYDRNEDGIIDREEAQESSFGRRFDDFDANGDGTVTEAEIVDRIKPRPAGNR